MPARWLDTVRSLSILTRIGGLSGGQRAVLPHRPAVPAGAVIRHLVHAARTARALQEASRVLKNVNDELIPILQGSLAADRADVQVHRRNGGLQLVRNLGDIVAGGHLPHDRPFAEREVNQWVPFKLSD